MMNDTIFAPSSAIGGAIVVLRVSGPAARECKQMLNKDLTGQPRVMQYVRAMEKNEVIDDCMAVYFPMPRSYTGEDMVEINCHGGTQTVQKLLSLLSQCGFRPAEPGEFTRRAFLNGKMDLSQAEAVMDVINASAEISLKAAILQLEGSIQEKISEAEQLLLDALSGIDAAIDYPDEAEQEAYANLPQFIQQAKRNLSTLIEEGRRGRVLRDGVRVVILGRPNVGKSSLMNALLGRQRAIVTPVAGTTRDVLDERVAFFGVPIRLIDTAGIHEATDQAESIGIARARNEMRTADMLLLLLDGTEPLNQEDRTLLQDTAGYPRILVRTKSDLPVHHSFDMEDPLPVSATNGTGLDALKHRVIALSAPAGEDCSCITNERHIHELEQAHAALEAIRTGSELELIATDIRVALQHIGVITGADVDSAVLDRIFSRFCVGK